LLFAARSINRLGFFRDISHPLPGKTGPDNITGQAFPVFLIFGLNPVPAKYIKTGRLPGFRQPDNLTR
jgi:hypothetical protein